MIILLTKRSLEVRRHPVHEDKILEALYKLLILDSINLALYVDFSLLRYPLIKITVMPIVADIDGEPYGLNELIGTSIMEIILNIESLYQNEVDLNKDVLSMKLLCEHGWIVYDYTVLRSEQGIPYTSKLWIHMTEGRPWHEAIDVDEEFSKYMNEVVSKIVVKARKILEYDGYL